MAQEPESFSPPRPSGFFGEGNRAMQTPPPLKGEPVPPSPFAAMMAVAQKRSEFFKQEGVAVLLRESNKTHRPGQNTGHCRPKIFPAARSTALYSPGGHHRLLPQQK